MIKLIPLLFLIGCSSVSSDLQLIKDMGCDFKSVEIKERGMMGGYHLRTGCYKPQNEELGE